MSLGHRAGRWLAFPFDPTAPTNRSSGSAAMLPISSTVLHPSAGSKLLSLNEM
jgi:hypothetical protein